jgi:ubiquinone/menaquinone biosynthesis C-methylase UbiE
MMKIVDWLPRYHRAQKFLRDLPADARVLDIACGEGDLTNYLAERGARIWGGDLCETDIRRGLPRNFHSNAAFVVADATRLPFATESLDWLVSFDTLDDIPDDMKAIGEFARVLKRNGCLLLSVPARAPSEGDLFWEQRALRRWLPKFLYTRSCNSKTGHSWFEFTRDDFIQLRDYPVTEVVRRFTAFELVAHDYAVKRFSSLATDFAYGVRGFPRLGLKPYLLWVGTRLDALFCRGPKHPGYTLLAKLRKR